MNPSTQESSREPLPSRVTRKPGAGLTMSGPASAFAVVQAASLAGVEGSGSTGQLGAGGTLVSAIRLAGASISPVTLKSSRIQPRVALPSWLPKNCAHRLPVGPLSSRPENRRRIRMTCPANGSSEKIDSTQIPEPVAPGSPGTNARPESSGFVDVQSPMKANTNWGKQVLDGPSLRSGSFGSK